MPSRSGGGMGVTVALVIFILLTLSLLLTTMLYYTKAERAQQEKVALERDIRAFIRPAERDSDEVKQLSNAAGAANKSVVAFQQDEMKQIMYRSAGNREMSRTGFEAQLGAQGIEESQSLLAAYRDRTLEAESQRNRAQSLEEQLEIAESRLADFTAERERLLAGHRAALDAQNNEIGRIQTRADDYAQRVEDAERQMDRRVDDIRSQYEGQVADLTAQLEATQNTTASQADAIQSLQRLLRDLRGTGADEGAQPDGQVLRVDNDVVYIDAGLRNHIVLGMRFEVYGDVTETRRDSQGNVPLGKATIEVTQVDETTSRARVIRSIPGRAVVASDVIVSPIYDRDKEYSFYVFGNFDLDGVGGATALETETVKSRIREWGGTIIDEFREDMDFLVVGIKPEPPGPLPPGVIDPDVIRALTEQRRLVTQYEEHVERAGRLSIPVLNQNRLFTLIGYYGP